MYDKRDVEKIAGALTFISEMPYPSLGIDLDAPLADHPIFFRLLAKHWPGKVIGFSASNAREAELIAQRLELRCDDVIVVESPEAKADAIVDSGVLAMISHDVNVVNQDLPYRAKLWLAQ